ncbi:hypothetical protein DYB26_016496 [Aphanomyces astaci]|uniref:Uncharacterized protein n=1 Tax=Aphanomyces astaci TaxID=112090 RepID=A0A418E3D0_APHAT|nr:hypothetical protein DYB26_016496 [Aphanomyces astaci]
MPWTWSYLLATTGTLSEFDPGRIARGVLQPVHRAWAALKTAEGPGPVRLRGGCCGHHKEDDNRWRLMRPGNPTFKGSTKEERRVFMAAYNLYIGQTNALTANGVRPFIMPVRACIEPARKQRIAEWDMGKDPDDVSEGEWIAWFKQGFDVDPRALDTLKKRIKSAVVFYMSVPDADSRIGRMLDGLAAAIRRDRQEWVIREVSQAIVKIITAAVKPASLHHAVTEQMALTRNKLLKKDVYRFVRWLRE